MPYGVNPLQSYQVYDADIFAIDGMEVRRIVFPRQKVHFDDDTVEPCDDRHLLFPYCLKVIIFAVPVHSKGRPASRNGLTQA